MSANAASQSAASPKLIESGLNSGQFAADMLIRSGLVDEALVSNTKRIIEKMGGEVSLFKILEKREKITRAQFLQCVRSQRPDVSIATILNQLGLVSTKQLRQAQQVQLHADTDITLAEILISKRMVKENDFTEVKAAHLGYSAVEVDIAECDKLLLKKVPLKSCKLHKFIPIRQGETGVVVAFEDPENQEARSEAARALNAGIETVVCAPSVLQQALAAFERQAAPKSAVEKKMAEEGSSSAQVTQILKSGIDQDTSDIHIEPMSERVRVRFRIDGIMRQHCELPSEELQGIVSRLKVMAEADIAERRRHQDGRIAFEDPDTGGISDLRASFYVTVHGEAVVLRVLNKNNKILQLKSIGMSATVMQRFRKHALELPSGVIIVTGPTGSGKTSTLYSCVQHLNNDSTSIITAEDPVEFQVDGISQCSVSPKLGRTFEESLRHIVRQDPDVIVLGEIRDASSASSAIQAALTGHKVLTTFHTEDSIGAILRLMNMNIETFLISSTVSCVIAQRLVRRVCPECSKGVKPKAADLQLLGWSLDNFNGGNFRESDGCENCNFSGYRGRVAVFETLILNEPVREAILERKTSVEIRRISMESSGFVTLLEDGLVKASRGAISIKEIIRTLPRLTQPRGLVDLIRLTGVR